MESGCRAQRAALAAHSARTPSSPSVMTTAHPRAAATNPASPRPHPSSSTRAPGATPPPSTKSARLRAPNHDAVPVMACPPATAPRSAMRVPVGSCVYVKRSPSWAADDGASATSSHQLTGLVGGAMEAGGEGVL